MENPAKSETFYQPLISYDPDEEVYESNGAIVTFPRIVRVRFNEEVFDTKLSFTREIPSGSPFDSATRPPADRTKRAIPCVRINGEKIMMNDERLELTVDSVLV